MVVLDAGNIVYKYEKDEMGEKLFFFFVHLHFTSCY